MSELPSPKILHPVLRSRWATLLLNLVLLALVVGSLFLPPMSLSKQPTPDPSAATGGQVWSVADPDGTELTIFAVGLPDDASPALELTSVPRADLLAGTAGENLQPIAQALPSYLSIKSPLYQIRVRGATPAAATLRIPIPNDAEPLRTLDVYGWSDDHWYRLDGRVREAKDDILIRLDSLPEAVAVMQTQGTDLVLSTPLPAGWSLSEKQLNTITEIHPDGGLIAEDGSILAKPSLWLPAVPSIRVMPTIRNWTDTGEVWRGPVNRIVNDEELRQAHVNALSQFVAQGGYDGVDIDYRGLMGESRAAFGQFITELAQKLHPQGKLVSVRVSLPAAITPDQWDTGPYDWPALSRVVDVLRAPMPLDPRAYRTDGQVHAFLDWAVGEADRYKLQLVFMPLAVEQAGSAITTLSYGEALALLTRLGTASVPETVAPSDEIPLELPVLRRSSGLLYDEALHTWWFTYLDERHHERTVWLNNAEGLASRAALANSYHLRGITIEGLTEPGNDPNLWAATYALSNGTEQPIAEQFSLQWQTTGPSSPTVVEASLAAENAAYTWTAPSTEGRYQIAIVVTQDDEPVVTGEPLPVLVGTSVAMVTPTPTPPPTSAPPTATPTPTPTPPSVPPTATPTPTPTPTTVSPTATPTAEPTATPQPTRVPSTATPTFTPAPTSTPTMPPGPALFEPESGASFPKVVRLKWTWHRRLQDYEKFDIRWEPTSGQGVGDWWVSEVGIIDGGGAIQTVEGGYLFEVNFGLDPYPGGEAYWCVAVVGETPSEKWWISQWSEKRQIFHGERP